MRGMTLIVKTVARLIAGLIFLYGVYVVLHGHLTPGGGFAGGIIIAGAFVLLILAEGIEEVAKEAEKWRASFWESFGIFCFWLLGMLGLFGGTYFLLNVIQKKFPGQPLQLFSAGIIPLCNIAIAIEVGAALLAIVITLAVLKIGEKK